MKNYSKVDSGKRTEERNVAGELPFAESVVAELALPKIM